MIFQALRSLVFYLVFFVHTIPLAIVVGLMAKLTPGWRGAGWAIGQYWNNANLFFLRWLVGIRTQVTGQKTSPKAE